MEFDFQTWAIDSDIANDLRSGQLARIYDTRTGASLTYEGELFVMRSPRGDIHTLLGIATDAARLNAHWRGFNDCISRDHLSTIS